MVVGMLSSASAFASVDCVAGPGVTQTATTVTGSAGHDTIDCGGASPGKTINGGLGNDTITRPTTRTRSTAVTATTR
jgi:hypothetical protein